jgi:hypothetical protein
MPEQTLSRIFGIHHLPVPGEPELGFLARTILDFTKALCVDLEMVVSAPPCAQQITLANEQRVQVRQLQALELQLHGIDLSVHVDEVPYKLVRRDVAILALLLLEGDRKKHQRQVSNDATQYATRMARKLVRHNLYKKRWELRRTGRDLAAVVNTAHGLLNRGRGQVFAELRELWVDTTVFLSMFTHGTESTRNMSRMDDSEKRLADEKEEVLKLALDKMGYEGGKRERRKLDKNLGPRGFFLRYHCSAQRTARLARGFARNQQVMWHCLLDNRETALDNTRGRLPRFQLRGTLTHYFNDNDGLQFTAVQRPTDGDGNEIGPYLYATHLPLYKGESRPARVMIKVRANHPPRPHADFSYSQTTH